MKSHIQFADKRTQKAFNELKETQNALHKWLEAAFEKIENDTFSGIQIPKNLIPKDYIKKFGINNLWKYNLPKGWRLLYSVQGSDLIVISIILNWFSHKEYERKFNY